MVLCVNLMRTLIWFEAMPLPTQLMNVHSERDNCLKIFDWDHPDNFKDSKEFMTAVQTMSSWITGDISVTFIIHYLLFWTATTQTVDCLHYDVAHYEFSRGVRTVPWENIMWLFNSNKKIWQESGKNPLEPLLVNKVCKSLSSLISSICPFRTGANKKVIKFKYAIRNPDNR